MKANWKEAERRRGYNTECGSLIGVLLYNLAYFLRNIPLSLLLFVCVPLKTTKLYMRELLEFAIVRVRS